MDKVTILNLVTDLQKLRCKFNTETQHHSIEIDHCLENFHEGLDKAIEAVGAIHAEIVLDEIETSHLAESKGKEATNV